MVDEFCALLEQRLSYAPGERDMVRPALALPTPRWLCLWPSTLLSLPLPDRLPAPSPCTINDIMFCHAIGPKFLRVHQRGIRLLTGSAHTTGRHAPQDRRGLSRSWARLFATAGASGLCTQLPHPSHLTCVGMYRRLAGDANMHPSRVRRDRRGVLHGFHCRSYGCCRRSFDPHRAAPNSWRDHSDNCRGL